MVLHSFQTLTSFHAGDQAAIRNPFPIHHDNNYRLPVPLHFATIRHHQYTSLASYYLVSSHAYVWQRNLLSSSSLFHQRPGHALSNEQPLVLSSHQEWGPSHQK